MDITELRNQYDELHRRGFVSPDAIRQDYPHLIRHLSTVEEWGYIIYSELDETNADAVIQEQADDFKRRGMGAEWKLFSHDKPADLKARLERHGFIPGEDEAIMVLDIARAPAILTQAPVHSITRITDPDGLQPVIQVLDEVYETHYADTFQMLSNRMRSHPDTISVFAGWDGDRPVTAGWSFFHPPSPFSGLYGGTTLASHRGQGYYTATVAARLQDALAHGMRYLTVDAGEMSRPILEKLGFVCIAISNPCEFTPSGSNP